MKVEQVKYEPRITIPFNRQQGIHHYGTGNVYPQIIEATIKASSTGKSISDTASKFIRGKGFAGGENVIVDKKGTTLNQLLRKVAKDVSKHNAYSLHIKYNLDQSKAEIIYIPFSWVRLGKKDSNDYIGKAIVYDNWGKDKGKKINSDDFNVLDVFNDNKEIVKAQIEKAGSIQEYKGQLFIHTFDDTTIYPLSPFDAVVTDMQVDTEIPIFRYKTIRNGFQNITLLRHLPFETPEKAEAFVEDIQSIQGSDNAGSMVAVEDKNIGRDKDTKGSFIIDELKSNLNDTLFESWINTTQLNVYKSWNVPEILTNFNKVGITNQSGETFKQAINIFNFQTLEHREEIASQFKRVLSNFKTDIVIDYKIEQINYEGGDNATNNQ